MNNLARNTKKEELYQTLMVSLENYVAHCMPENKSALNKIGELLSMIHYR
ncbi:hypothetical protein JCM19232_2627 [Vibrio ishigakensis]|uniref:Uncharacterized protein n=1 Tax=Vibrio ishigakensis TaxID=1481914 RepID=A0A0B8PG96_9VIBR|nr:hypothetical protein JCM19232_2627 [Vibrio ishigakensis]